MNIAEIDILNVDNIKKKAVNNINILVLFMAITFGKEFCLFIFMNALFIALFEIFIAIKEKIKTRTENIMLMP